ADLAIRVTELLEAKHLSMLKDLNDGLNTLGDRLSNFSGDRADALRAGIEQQLRQTRDALVALQISNNQEMAHNREALLANLGEQRVVMVQRLAEMRSEILDRSLTALNGMRSEINQEMAAVREGLLGQLGEQQVMVVQRLAEMRSEILDKSLGALNGMHTEIQQEMAATREGLLGQLGEQQVTVVQRLAEMRSEILDKSVSALTEMRSRIDQELAANREGMLASLGEQRVVVVQRLAEMRTEILEKALTLLGDQGRAQSETLQDSIRALSQQLTGSIESLTRTADTRLEQIQGQVQERLEEGFRKTNETFVSVMERLATIDEAQKKIDGLTTNVVSLQELLGDKRSRGAFGEVQLEALVRNILSPGAYTFQATLGNGTRADCLLHLPEPTGTVAVDSKFPLENYHRMFEPGQSEFDRAAAQRLFRTDIRRHVDDIATRYILPGETSDGAVMFVPAEAVFAEIHAYHAEIVDHALQRRVWIVSPTTMMAVLNTARAVIKDVETRRQVHVIKDELGKLGRDFGRFDQRMRKLADHIRMAHQDAEDVRVSSDKITRRFHQIEQVELEAAADVARLERALQEPEAPEVDPAAT
ncbi:MAG: DNA recombination protein RmuC, partial [Burkholderiales bacterium]|nr:DNA recombination protein RmuC [Burkholderiales bacterium]